MSSLERLTGEETEDILTEEQRRKALLYYLKLVRLRAQLTNCSVLEIIGSDLAHATNGRIGLRHREKPPEPKAITTVYSFSTPHGDLVYYPRRRIAVSPLLPEGTLVQLTPLQGLFLEAFMKNPAAVHTKAELVSLIQETLGEAPTPNESSRTQVLIYRLRRKLGEDVLEKGDGRYFGHRLIHTIPAGYTLVPNLNYVNKSCPEKPQEISS